jgi:uncharacterized membrane protein YhaH (DUF805 family)
MDWNWFLFSFEGRIGRAQCWLAGLVWWVCGGVITLAVLLATAFVLWATGVQVDAIRTSTIPWVRYLIGLPLLAAGIWIVAATATKRLHDRERSGLWVLPFFVAPLLLDRLWDWLESPVPALIVSGVSAALSLWCFVELFCLRGTAGPNRYGADPLAEIVATPRWDQQTELEIVPPSAGPPANPHVNRTHDRRPLPHP